MNSQGPACRRCRADLSLLFQLEAQRDRLLAEARDFLLHGQLHRTLTLLGRAQDLRRDEDMRPLRAVCHLLRRDFAVAWRDYRKLKPQSSSPVP
jgi:hypothetical protein